MPDIITTLEQSERWYGQKGIPYRLSNMDESHIHNVLRMLRARASALQLQRDWSHYLDANGLCEEDVDRDMEFAFIRWLGAQPALDESPAEWLERRPLIQALKRELRARGTLDGDVVGVRYDLELEENSDGTDGRAVGADPRLRDRPALG